MACLLEELEKKFNRKDWIKEGCNVIAHYSKMHNGTYYYRIDYDNEFCEGSEDYRIIKFEDFDIELYDVIKSIKSNEDKSDYDYNVIEELEKIKNALDISDKIEELTKMQKWFLNDYFRNIEELIEEEYIDDRMSEFSDNNISIYYSDIYDNLIDKIDEVDDVLEENGYSLGEFKSLNDAIVKGVNLLEYYKTLEELNEDFRIQELQELLQEFEGEEE